ncbi:HlyU family transcriptional regulator [Roseovarius sp.]|uniref:HlyU family transcriptional regulator n=1 Tax=Roseovarius sp. TaxID=1486281 RepID=UPI0025E31EE2|nr:HlyU family transcriptional regulator [Roseovarius sp.]
MSLWSKLFGGGAGGSDAKPEAKSEIYKGFRIMAEPQSGEGGYRVGARIEKEIGGEVKVHHLLRADAVLNRDEAAAFSIRKAKQAIDDLGDRIFR